jgi:hypothetical protein
MKHFLLIAVLCVWPSSSFADLVHKFNNPAFNGAGYSSHVMAIEQLQKNRTDEAEAEAERLAEELERVDDNSVLAKFTRNLESRIYATLSKQLVDSMFASCGEGTDIPVCPTSGTTDIEGAEITWTKDSITGGITLVVDGPDGYTEVTIPGPGEFNF